MLADARKDPGCGVASRLAGRISARVLVKPENGVQSIWVAVSWLDVDKKIVPSEFRDVIFKHFEMCAGPGEWDAVDDWFDGRRLPYFECTRLGVTQSD